MKSKFVYIMCVPALIALVACHKPMKPADTGLTDSSGAESQTLISITEEQFKTVAMELGGLNLYQDAERVTCNGYLDVPPENRVRIGTFLGGYVKSLDLIPGHPVKKNQTLMVLENIEYLTLQQEFLEARAQFEYIGSVYENQKSLADEKITAQKTFLETKSSYFALMARVESLAKQLQLIHIDPETLTPDALSSSINLKSPIDGFITEVSVVKGMFVNPSEVLCEIVNTSHLHIELKVFEKDLSHLRVGQLIEFRVPEASTEQFKGEIILVGQVIGITERTVSVHGHINSEYGRHLAPGMYVEAQIHTEPRQVHGLPITALVTEDNKHFVFVLEHRKGNDITFIKMPVHVGKIAEDWFELSDTTGLKSSGGRILIEGAYYLAQEN